MSTYYTTLRRLYQNIYGRNLAEKLAEFDDMEDRIEYTISFINETCHLDIHDYLRKIFTLDMIVLNEDRHVNNLAVVLTEHGFRPAPIFDQGNSLLTTNLSVNRYFPVEENVSRVVARPFCGSHEKMFYYLGKGFELDILASLQWLESEPDSREKQVLQYQLNKYRDIFE